MLNPSMLRLQWKTSKARISVTLAVKYCLHGLSYIHVSERNARLYMYFRTVVITFIVLLDSFYAHVKLRWTPKLYAKVGAALAIADGGQSLSCIRRLLYLLFDAFRHYVIMFVADDVSLVTFNVTNPFNGNKMALTNKRLASITYVNGMIFAAIAFKAMLGFTKMKTMSQTKFVYKN